MLRVFVYLDDSLGTSEFTGELLAVNDYNHNNEKRKISIQNLVAERLSLNWMKWIYLGNKFPIQSKIKRRNPIPSNKSEK